MGKQTLTFSAIGTEWIIDLPTVSSSSLKPLSQEINARIELFDNTYSRFKKDSFITRLSKKKGTFPLPSDALPLLSLYYSLYSLSQGSFTPLIGSVLEEAGYDRSYSLQEKTLHHPLPFDEIVSFTSQTITLEQPILLDFGAAGKGYLVDIISSLLLEKDIREFCVDAGGDMYYSSPEKKPLRVGLEHPENVHQIIGVSTITNQSICASAGNRRTWGKYHHIINPQTLTSPHNILSVWVIAEHAMVADALATCLFFTSPSLLKKEFSFEYLILFSDYTVEKSDKFPAELYYT